MKTKIVYVVVSSEKDIYLEQAYISMNSARHHMPDVHISLVIDDLTNESLSGTRAEEAKYADDVIVFPLDRSLSGQKRSRLLKTNLRNIIQGDYLFIDTDTIIVKPLYEVDDFSYDIAACWDSHTTFTNNPYRRLCIEHGHLLGWNIENETFYFNSGVILAKDNEFTRRFYKKWNSEYLIGYEKGVSMDQPSFAKSNFEFNHPIQKLPDIWNCEFKYGIRYLADAKIIHYLCTSRVDKEEPPFLLNDRIFFDYIKTYGKLPDEVVRIFDHPFEGVASLSYLLSGKDLQFAHDPLYKDLKSCYLLHQNKYKVLSFLVRFSISPIKVFIDMLKHMGILSWAISLKRIIINQKT